MGLEDFTEADTDTQQDNSSNDSQEENGQIKIAGIENNIRERALKSKRVQVDGNGAITIESRLLARWFALMCLDYKEADLDNI